MGIDDYSKFKPFSFEFITENLHLNNSKHCIYLIHHTLQMNKSHIIICWTFSIFKN